VSASFSLLCYKVIAYFRCKAVERVFSNLVLLVLAEVSCPFVSGNLNVLSDQGRSKPSSTPISAGHGFPLSVVWGGWVV
jgi:hypothetical protein